MNIRHKVQTILSKYGLSLEDEAAASTSEKQLEDGTTVVSDGDFVAGSNIFVINEEGEQIPVPTGEYTTTDGEVIQVEDGVIAGEAEGGTEEPSEGENTEKPAEMEGDPLEEDEEMEEDEEEEKMMAKMSTILSKLEQKHQEAINKLRKENRKLRAELKEDAGRINRTPQLKEEVRLKSMTPAQQRAFKLYNDYK